MKVCLRLRRNFCLKLNSVFLIWIVGVLTSLLLYVPGQGFSAEKNTAQLEREVKSKTYKEWFNHYFPYFNPTSAELHDELKKDPNWAPFMQAQTSNGGGQQAAVGVPDIPKSVIDPSQLPKKESLPEGVHMAVIIPKGVTLPGKSAQTQAGVIKMPEVSQTETKPLKASSLPAPPNPGIQTAIVPSSSGSGIVSERLSLPSSGTYVGFWDGQYSKLIEYYDANTNSWRTSENSLKDIPVELKLEENGHLMYKMPKREGSATYVLNGNILSILCQDVRVRGDYFVQQKDPQNLNLKTSRELVKDKMRVSLEFELILKQ